MERRKKGVWVGERFGLLQTYFWPRREGFQGDCWMGHPDPVKPLAVALMTVRASLGTVLGCVVEGHFL